MKLEHLHYDFDDRVATITFNRPRQLNAFNTRLIDEFMQAVSHADRDPEVRVVVIRGAGGKAFSSGYDMKEAGQEPHHTLDEWRARMRTDIAFTYSVWDCKKPVIAEINGFCLAGALELAMCCDMRFCAEDARFAALEARFSHGISTMIMPWLIGQRSRALIYTGDTFGADEAFRLGLVDKVFPSADLSGEVAKIASRMSRVSLQCLETNKRALNQAFEIMGLRTAIHSAAEMSAVLGAGGSPELDRFNAIRGSDGLAAALAWRAEQFAPYE